MNREIMEKILEKIKEYDRIMIFRHIRNDGDCVGATKGFKTILQQSFPEKEIYLIDRERAAYLEFMGPDDEEVADEIRLLMAVINNGNMMEAKQNEKTNEPVDVIAEEERAKKQPET